MHVLCSFLAPSTTVALMEPLFFLAGRRRGRARPDLQTAKRILVIRVDDIGDVVLFSGFLRRLRESRPEAHITLVVKKEVFALVEPCPHVDALLAYRCPHQIDYSDKLERVVLRLRQHFRAFFFAVQHLWPLRAEVALVPRFDVDRYYASYLAYFSGAPVRIGYSTSCTPWKANGTDGYDALFTTVFHADRSMHEAERVPEFLRFLGLDDAPAPPELWLGEEDERFAAQFFAQIPEDRQRCVMALGIGAQAAMRQWPIENMIALCRHLEAKGCAMVLIGGRKDLAAAAEVVSAGGPFVFDCVGRFTLRETAALLKTCALYIGNDTGPMHLAAAGGVPVVEISCHPRNGPRDFHRSPACFGPWNVPCEILQPETPLPPCIDSCCEPAAHCIRQISVADVIAAVERLSGHGVRGAAMETSDRL